MTRMTGVQSSLRTTQLDRKYIKTIDVYSGSREGEQLQVAAKPVISETILIPK